MQSPKSMMYKTAVLTCLSFFLCDFVVIRVEKAVVDG